MPTRYKVKKEIEIKDLNDEDLQNPELKKKAVEKINEQFSRAYSNTHVDRAKIGFGANYLGKILIVILG